jgi:two-component system, NtrC family, response regulator AlgB
MAKLLIVDDGRNIRRHLATFFESRGLEVRTAESGKDALSQLLAEGDFDLVLADYRMAEMNGLELLREIKRRHPDVTIILMTAYGTVQGAVAALKAGAYDYLAKPFSLEQIGHVVERALEVQSLRTENRLLRETVESRPFLESGSPSMRRVLNSARQFAAIDAPILLVGESGTGKKVLGRQIHSWSPRGEQPFIIVNCTTLPDHAIEKELFGQVLGAIAEGFKDKPGLFDAAEGGTVFLDEVADLSLPLQTRLLRFVIDRSFERAGGQETIRADTRIVAASSKDLAAEVAAGRFREELLYRLNAVSLHLPPLHERPEDILPLAEWLLSSAGVHNRRPRLHFSSEAAAAIARYRWPGNVRELRNAVQRAAVLARTDVIKPEHLPDPLFRIASEGSPPPSLEDIEREHIARVMAETATHEDAAAALGINVATLWRKRKRYNLD